MNRKRLGRLPQALITAAVATAGLATAAGLVTRSARETERAHPADGRFVVVEGVKLHYLERGDGPPIVLLHGNGVTAQDWAVSGVFDGLATDHRVIAFDRPGFGYSDRPRNVDWTPVQQAELLHRALTQLGITGYVLVGHSWGTLVALALALNYPADVTRVVCTFRVLFPIAAPRRAACGCTGHPIHRGCAALHHGADYRPVDDALTDPPIVCASTGTRSL